MIKVTYKTLTNQIWKTKTYKTLKAARLAKQRENLAYGAHLRAEATDLTTNKTVYIMS